MRGKKIAFRTLGCRLNQFETDALASSFDKNNFEIVNFDKQADVYVINTCTVTNQGDQKSRQEIHKAVRKKQDAIVVMTGCMVDNYKKNLEQFDGVDYFVDNAHKKSIPQLISAHYRGGTISRLPADVFGFEAARKTFHTRSMIKIQDGCDNFCTYCIVPKVRGRAVSRPPEDILQNIRQVLRFGYKEIVLTGVNIGRYHYEGTDFERLLDHILEIPGNFRVRISSIEPEGFGNRLIDLFSHPKLNPHLHLCIQSGSDKTLMKMRRFYTLRTYMDIIDKIKAKHPDFNFTTDIIVGFPGETEQEFQESVNVVREVGFSHIHTFKYSIRNGTRAARMDSQVPEVVKKERSRIMRDISNENKLKYRKSLLGKEQKLLVERINDLGVARGYGELYVPIEVESPELKVNEFYPVKLQSLKDKKNPAMVGTLFI